MGWFNLSGRQRWVHLGDNTKEVYALCFCDFFLSEACISPQPQKNSCRKTFSRGEMELDSRKTFSRGEMELDSTSIPLSLTSEMNVLHMGSTFVFFYVIYSSPLLQVSLFKIPNCGKSLTSLSINIFISNKKSAHLKVSIRCFI